MTKVPAPLSLPWRQLAILSICRLADPIAHTSVYPYLPEMIESFNVPEIEVSKWAGTISALFSLSQACTGILWGRASDRFGRKPVILCGMLCIMSSTVLFGLSTSLKWAVISRCLSGASNGNAGLMRTVVAELVPQKELQPRAFSVMPMIWTIGSIFGPGFGGALANPARKFPNARNIRFFKKYPFALPNLVAAAVFMVGLIVGILFLQETLHAKKGKRDYGLICGRILLHPCSNSRNGTVPARHEHSVRSLKHGRESSWSSSIDGNTTPTDNQNPATTSPKYAEIFSYQSIVNLLVYSLLALHSTAYDQLLPILMHYPRQTTRPPRASIHLPLKFTGGFGINSDRIGTLFMVYGVAGMFIQFAAFPPLATRWGALRCLKVISMMFPVIYVITPFTALLPTSESQQLSMLLIMFFKCWASVFAFPCTTILMTNSATSLRILGSLNGFAVSFSALGKALGPAVGGWTFTLGVEIGYGILPWWTLAAFAVAAAVPVWWLKEMDGIGGDEEPDGDRLVEENNGFDGDDDDSDYAAEDDTLLSSHHMSKNMSRERSDQSRSRRMHSPMGEVGG